MVSHRVETPSYPLFREPQYALSLATKIVQVSRQENLDIVHAHYAVPHATAAYLARQMLDVSPGRAPRTVTTLHGTDITLVGSDPITYDPNGVNPSMGGGTSVSMQNATTASMLSQRRQCDSTGRPHSRIAVNRSACVRVGEPQIT